MAVEEMVGIVGNHRSSGCSSRDCRSDDRAHARSGLAVHPDSTLIRQRQTLHFNSDLNAQGRKSAT